MHHPLLTALLGVLLCTRGASALEAVGTLKKVDADNRRLIVFADGEDRFLMAAADVRILGTDGKPLDGGLRSTSLKPGTVVTVTVEFEDGRPVLKGLRLGAAAGRPAGNAPVLVGRPAVGIKPLTDMSVGDTYKGEDGGLYGGYRNEPPPALRALAEAETAKIVPLDARGERAPDGKIGLVSLSMSNATMEFSAFKQLADADSDKSPSVSIVDCAQGGQAMAQWVDPRGRASTEADRRLVAARVRPEQVQVIWVKRANIMPTGTLWEHGERLRRDTTNLLQNAQQRFPNLRIAYLSGRIYGGWAATPLNPEPYAYESNVVVRWMIRDQAGGDPQRNYDPARGKVKLPLLLWGPYLWADGTTPRKADGLVWQRQDLAADGTHHSPSGRRKVAEMLLNFFKNDPMVRTWFVKR
jgi:hypothetical protein